MREDTGRVSYRKQKQVLILAVLQTVDWLTSVTLSIRSSFTYL